MVSSLYTLTLTFFSSTILLFDYPLEYRLVLREKILTSLPFTESDATIKASVYERWRNAEKYEAEERENEKEPVEKSIVKDLDVRAYSLNNVDTKKFAPEKCRETRRTAPVRRKKFPLGMTERDRGSLSQNGSVIIQRF